MFNLFGSFTITTKDNLIVVALLLAAGADRSATTRWGTALSSAEKKGHAAVAALLR